MAHEGSACENGPEHPCGRSRERFSAGGAIETLPSTTEVLRFRERQRSVKAKHSLEKRAVRRKRRDSSLRSE